MAVPRRTSHSSAASPVVRAIICAVGLFGGLMAGGIVVYVTGLWSRLDRVLGASSRSVSINDVLGAGASFVVVFICAWLGIWIGLRLASRI
jgi:hypothetical protein